MNRSRPKPTFPGTTCLLHFERRRGLPLANVHLDGLDQFVERQIAAGGLLRYVDDFLFGSSKVELNEFRARIEEYLVSLRLLLHPGKSRVYRTADGVTFLGWRIFPDHRRLKRRNVVRFRGRLRGLAEDYTDGLISWDGVRASVMAWNGHACHGDTWRLREQIFQQVPFSKPIVMPGQS
jgi:hypothetical protein